MNTANELRQALDKWIDEQDMDIENPLEPLKVANALKSEVMKWEMREKNEDTHSPLDITIIYALDHVLGDIMDEVE